MQESRGSMNFIIKYNNGVDINRFKGIPGITSPTKNKQTKKKHTKGISQSQHTHFTKCRLFSGDSACQANHNLQFMPSTPKLDTKHRVYSRIGIQYCDLCLHTQGKGRVVYRGYAPKNTHYYLRVLKDASQIDSKWEEGRRHIFKNELIFDSKFESGNLATAVYINSNEYWLYMREDINTHGLRQWFHYSVQSGKAATIKFRIYKFSKHYSLYRIGMKPYVRTLSKKSRGLGRTGQQYKQQESIKNEWHQDGNKVKYQFDSQQHCYYLSFQYTFPQGYSKTYFATMPTYTYTHLQSYLKLISINHNFIIDVCGRSLAGLDIPIISILQSTPQLKFKQNKKKAIVVLGRIHPGETCSNYTIQALLAQIVKTPKLYRFYDVVVIPMVNPDGVWLGNHRTSAAGQDINRNFNSIDLQCFPQVQAVKRVITKLQLSHNIEFLIDLHGHSTRRNIFAYGPQHEIGSKGYLNSRILPYLLWQRLSSFKYYQCIFRKVKQKVRTARVYFEGKHKIKTLTFEQSYGLMDEGTMSIVHWRNFGIALVDSLCEYINIITNNEENIMEKYLKDQIKKDIIRNNRKIQKQLLLDRNKMDKLQNVNLVPDAKFENGKEETVNQYDKSKQKQIDQIQQFPRQKLPSVKEQKQAKQLYISQILHKQQTQTEQLILHQPKHKLQQNSTLSCNQFKPLLALQYKKNELEKKNESLNEKEGSEANSSELSSGDTSLELKDEELDRLKVGFKKIGCLRLAKRQTYDVSGKQLELMMGYSQSIEARKPAIMPNMLRLELLHRGRKNLLSNSEEHHQRYLNKQHTRHLSKDHTRKLKKEDVIEKDKLAEKEFKLQINGNDKFYNSPQNQEGQIVNFPSIRSIECGRERVWHAAMRHKDGYKYMHRYFKQKKQKNNMMFPPLQK